MCRSLITGVVVLALACAAPAAPQKTTKSSKPAAKKPVAQKVETKKEEEKKELAPGELPLAARAAVVLDAATGELLYEKNPDTLEYPASATKILTALLVIENGDLDKMVTVEHADTQVEPSAMYIKAGETYPRRNLLYALMIKSANDVALALARDNAGSVEAFAERMTQRAHALGAESSHFKNPHGLHDPHHYTTARDLARIGAEAMKSPLFRDIVKTPEVWIRKPDDWIVFRNRNRLLTRMVECVGVKTGYTRAAQQVLVSAATKAGKEVVSVVLHTNKPGIWDDSELLLKHGLAKLTEPPPAPATEPAAEPAEPAPPAGPAPPAEPAAPSQPSAPAQASAVPSPGTP